MLEYKTINLRFFNLALATAIGLSNSPILAKKIAVASKSQGSSVTIVGDANLQRRSFNVATVKASSSDSLVGEREDWLLADGKNSAAIAASENDDTKTAEPNLKLVRLIFLSCFLLLFVPLGIFYPFFLFYRQLLSRNSNFNYFKDDNKSEFPKFSDPAEIYNSSSQYSNFSIPGASANNLHPFPLHLRQISSNSQNNSTKADRFPKRNSKAKIILDLQQQTTSTATVSKLQIAFTPPAKKLRGNLSQVTSTTEQTTYDIAELMRKAVSVLLTHQQYWTHVSYSSDSLPLEKIRSEFEVISYLERNKCLTEELGFVNRKRPANKFNSFNRDDSYNYVVVTLILCTSHNSPLFDRIHTEAQLIEELIQLSQMKDNRLTEFELLWNPQQETEYISNERLLTQYSDLIRLL